MNRLKYLFTLVAISLIIPQGVTAQTERKFTLLALGLNAGYFHPLGGWTAHPYAKGIDLFRGGVAFNGGLELVTPSLGIALNAGYAGLNLRQWEDYASAAGDHIEASASLFHFGVLLKPHLKTSQRHVIKLELGLLYFAPQGEERFAGRRFDYDFLKSGLAFTAGLGYDRYVGRTTALAFKIGGTFAPLGVKYADGKNHGINGMPISAGIRFDLGSISRRATPNLAQQPAGVPLRNLEKYGQLAVSQPESLKTAVSNDVQSALIVISDVPNLQFESTRRIFERRQRGPNEWQLMVEPDSHIVTIQASGYLPVKTAMLFLQPQRDYLLKVSQVKPPGMLIIQTKSEDAGLRLSNAPIIAKNPLEIYAPNLGGEKLGELTISQPEELPAVVRDENRSALYIISEVPNLAFESSRQIFEKRQRGASEWQLFVEPDSQNLTIQAPGYSPLQTGIMCPRAKRAYRLNVSQVKPVPGTLFIKTKPESAGLRLNGVPIAGKTPYRLDATLPGSYYIQVAKEGHLPKDTTLIVESGKVAAWETRLIQTAVRVQIDLKNKKLRDVGILINGEAKGFAPGAIYLAPGRYKLMLQKKGYHDKKKDIVIASGRNEIRLAEKMKPIRPFYKKVWFWYGTNVIVGIVVLIIAASGS